MASKKAVIETSYVKADGALETYHPVGNGASEEIGYTEPYVAQVTIQGTCPILCHAWNVEAIKEKANSAKGSKAKKTDDVESYVYRDEQGEICIPGEYLRQAMIHAAKFKQDPRSPRKSAMDLFKAGLFVDPELSSFGSKDWDYLDERRAMVQRQGINRTRPAFSRGWTLSFTINVLLPEYISPDLLHAVLSDAGRLVGIGNYRPTYGRFIITRFDVAKE